MEDAYWSECAAAVMVRCRFWKEDGIWNGSAKRLPIAVFGQTLEETKANMRDAFRSHIEAIQGE